MKKLLFVLFLLVCFSSPALAVNLTWDENLPSQNVDKYQVEIQDFNSVIVANPEVPVNTWVIVSIPDGVYSARVRAHNVWGWSAYTAPLDFTKALPDVPLNIRLEL